MGKKCCVNDSACLIHLLLPRSKQNTVADTRRRGVAIAHDVGKKDDLSFYHNGSQQ